MARDKKDKKVAKGKTGKEVVTEQPSSNITSWTCAECGQVHEGEDAAETACVACEAPRPEMDGSNTEVNDRFKGYKVGLVTSMEELAGKLRALAVDVGGDSPLTVVTNAGNVVEGSRVVVATEGSVVSGKGEEITVKKASVGGRASQGMICDSTMLGWVGGGAGAAALLPETFAPGDTPPVSRPRMDGK